MPLAPGSAPRRQGSETNDTLKAVRIAFNIPGPLPQIKGYHHHRAEVGSTPRRMGLRTETGPTWRTDATHGHRLRQSRASAHSFLKLFGAPKVVRTTLGARRRIFSCTRWNARAPRCRRGGGQWRGTANLSLHFVQLSAHVGTGGTSGAGVDVIAAGSAASGGVVPPAPSSAAAPPAPSPAAPIASLTASTARIISSRSAVRRWRRRHAPRCAIPASRVGVPSPGVAHARRLIQRVQSSSDVSLESIPAIGQQKKNSQQARGRPRKTILRLPPAAGALETRVSN